MSVERTALNKQWRNTASLSCFPGDKSSLNGGECKSFPGTSCAPALFRYIVKCCQGNAWQVWGSVLSLAAHGAGWGAAGLSLRVPVWTQHRQLSAERWHFLVWRWQRLSAGSRSTARVTPCLFTNDIRAGDVCRWHFDSPGNVETSLKHRVMKSLLSTHNQNNWGVPDLCGPHHSHHPAAPQVYIRAHTHMNSTFSHIVPPTHSVENLSQIRCPRKHEEPKFSPKKNLKYHKTTESCK